MQYSQTRSQHLGVFASALLHTVLHNSKQQWLPELKQLPHDRWFKLMLSQKVGLSGQTVLRPRLCPKEAGYEGSYCTYLSIFLNNFWGEII